jgi:riboflavin synthase
MFTGLIEHTGTVERTTPTPSGVRLEIDPRSWTARPAPGDSVAVSGCCLTIADERAQSGGCLAFDLVPETLARTTLGNLRPGSPVNLERSATPATLLGGHIVQGHVDGIARVASIDAAAQWRIRFAVDRDLIEYITPKGSICVEGVSLTVADVHILPPAQSTPASAGWFEVALIPTTLAKTTLGNLQVGHTANIESDVVGRTIIHWIRHFGDPTKIPQRGPGVF